MPSVKPLRIDEVPAFEVALRSAFRAVAVGNATPGQQRAVMRFVTGDLCGVASRPPAGLSEHDSGFLSGRRWVGIVMLEIANVPLFRAEEEEA